MSTRLYAEVNQQTIHQLKAQGFSSVQFVLLDRGDPYQATIEPLMSEEAEIDTLSLFSGEISDYMDGSSNMARYIIDQKYVDRHTPDNHKIPGPS